MRSYVFRPYGDASSVRSRAPRANPSLVTSRVTASPRPCPRAVGARDPADVRVRDVADDRRQRAGDDRSVCVLGDRDRDLVGEQWVGARQRRLRRLGRHPEVRERFARDRCVSEHVCRRLREPDAKAGRIGARFQGRVAHHLRHPRELGEAVRDEELRDVVVEAHPRDDASGLPVGEEERLGLGDPRGRVAVVHGPDRGAIRREVDLAGHPHDAVAIQVPTGRVQVGHPSPEVAEVAVGLLGKGRHVAGCYDQRPQSNAEDLRSQYEVMGPARRTR